MDEVECRQGLKEHGQSLGRQVRFQRERLLGELAKLTRIRRKLNAFPFRLLLALPPCFTFLRLSWTWPSSKLCPRI